MSATNTDWTALQQAEDMAYFRADLCCYFTRGAAARLSRA